MPDTTTYIYDVRCSSCRRRIAYAEFNKALRNAVYCSEWCYLEPAATELEVRNDEWKILVESGVSPHAVSLSYGVAHSLVYRTLKRV